jgi:hypothetical protein
MISGLPTLAFNGWGGKARSKKPPQWWIIKFLKYYASLKFASVPGK